MDIRKCKLFMITAETGKISRAATITGYTQSGVSHILKSLEEEVGVPLFKRDRYGVHLTPAGSEFMIYVKRFLAENDRIEQYVNELHGVEVGTITIGTFTSVSIGWLPRILKQFHIAHPGIEIVINEGGFDDIEKWISDMDVDIAFLSRQPRYELDFIPLKNDPLVAIFPPDYPLDPKWDAFPVEKLNGAPFILSETGIEYDINRYLTQHKVQPSVIFSSKEDTTIMAMVEQGLGVSVLPELSVQYGKRDVQVLPLKPSYYRDLGVGLLNRDSVSPIVQAFLHTVDDFIQREVNGTGQVEEV